MTPFQSDPEALRPELDGWLRARRVPTEQAAAAFGISAVQLGRYCLPFSSERRQVPRQGALERIIAFTGGEITAEHFYPPHLRAKPADEDYAPARDFLVAEGAA